MTRSIRIISFIVALLLLAAFGSKGAVLAQDPGTRDTLRIDTTIAFVSGSGVVPIRFYNDEPLLGLEVTLDQPVTEVNIDSFSFVGGRVAGSEFIRNVRVSTDSTIITISVIGTTNNIPAGSGVLGHIYLSYAETIVPQVVPIDTVAWAPEPDKDYRTQFFLPTLVGYVPFFIPGALAIEEAPPVADSIWIPNIEAYPGQPLAVQVHLYNERPVKDVSLALTWGSEYLHFDSARYAGGRADAAQTKQVQTSNATHQLLANINFGEATPLASGTGLFLRLYFSVATAPDTNITLDTITFLNIQNTYFNLTSLDGNAQISPRFHEGIVHINAGTDVEDEEPTLPEAFALGQNYPNPFNPTTTIEFALPRASHVSIELYDILGRSVRTLVDQQMSAGEHRVMFDGRSSSGNMLATGIYFYRMSTESFATTRKMVLMK